VSIACTRPSGTSVSFSDSSPVRSRILSSPTDQRVVAQRM
jgi:hypothetical protein